MKVVTNLYRQKENRQALRNNATPAERTLWWELKGKKLMNLKWRRQFSIQNYIVDFYCPEKKIVIEIDGDTHYREEAKKYDKQRTQFLEKNGIRVIRFTNEEVQKATDVCLEKLRNFVEEK